MPWSLFETATRTLGDIFGGQQPPADGARQTPPMVDELTQRQAPPLAEGQVADAYGSRFSGPGAVEFTQQARATLPAQSAVQPAQPLQPQGAMGGYLPPIAPFVDPLPLPQTPPQRPISVASIFAGRRR